jgi:hypothetical protein
MDLMQRAWHEHLTRGAWKMDREKRLRLTRLTTSAG